MKMEFLIRAQRKDNALSEKQVLDVECRWFVSKHM